MTQWHKYWGLLIILLVAIIAVSGIVAWSRYTRSQPVEISLPTRPELQGAIHVDGAVSNPGLYPFNTSDTLETIIRDAGGTTDGAEVSALKLYVPRTAEAPSAQKVNLNRAEAWLLEALPGIGQTRAQAIIVYRRQHGPFHDTGELMKVEGIGAATFERIRDLVTVD